ncbi:MAG: hypothetical protein H0U49_06030, partial [Parachlamydiaceae bacterium]|nr:hypothetical protein [Parachlamydiaceae bacterium]
MTKLTTLFLAFCIAFSGLSAGILDHLKIPNDKSPSTPMRNIDFIYLINLDQRPEKLAHSIEQLAPYGIVPYRFSPVNGWELPFEVINDVGIKYDPWMKQGLMGTCYLPEDEGVPRHEVMQVTGRNY